MAVDNPSYFSLRGGDAGSSTGPRGFGGFFRRSKSTVAKVQGRCAPAEQQQQQQQQPMAKGPTSRQRGTQGAQRRSFRNLFRSASASADCEKTRQFLKGEPRPSDVAPPSPYLNSRSHVHSDSGRCKQARRAKAAGELLNMDMIFCGLSGENNLASGPAAGSSPGVQLSRRTEDNDYYRFERESECGSEAATLPLDEEEDERSYYNLTATLPSIGSPSYASMGRHHKYRQQQQQRRRRRHSIGTFLDGDRGASALTNAATRQAARSTDLVVEPDLSGSCDVVDHADECHRMQSRLGRTDRFGTRHAPGAFPSKTAELQTARDDVVFIWSKDNEASALWVNYLTACFEQISRQQGRPPFRVTQVTVEEPLSPGADLKIRSSRLQIVVVCPMLLERVAERPEQASLLTRQLTAERVLAMMLGVQDAQLTSVHRASLVACQHWRKFFVKDQDETFVGQFLGAAVAILGTAGPAAPANGLKVDKTSFSVHPKKVKMGQNRVLALLNDPLHPDDNVCVTVDRCGEAIEVCHVKRRNPYTLQFSIPERCLDVSMLVGVRIARNGSPLGVRQVKCESRLRELDQILRAHDNPLEFMCQTFGFNPGDREQLDNWMVHAFQKNIPPHFNLLSNPSGDLQLSKNHSSSEENPTLLHFAARFGLEKLAWQLLECPGGDIACDTRNCNDHTPADLAEQGNHPRLAHQLRGYMQMNEFSNMYSYLKVMSESAGGKLSSMREEAHSRTRLQASTPGTTRAPSQQSERSEDGPRQEDYCRPRPISEAYAVPPTARPVTCRFPDYSTPPPLPQPNPVVAAIAQEDSPLPLSAYASSSTLNASSLELPLQGLRSCDSAASTPTATTSSHVANGHQTPETPTGEPRVECEQLQGSKSSLSRSSQSSGKSRESPQDELLEIITDFKNNVFTISEVERLVENWRNRNDVQQSFKDKQRQLSAMRDEYERIQKRIKDEMKAPTPFDRIKKFFTKGKKDSKDSGSVNEEPTPIKQNGVGSNLSDRRPVSSLSLHSVSSSSSSGRMSTASGCSGTSLGDSGTHSDTDDRRLQHPASEEKAAGMTSYEIPPAPKPFHGRLFHQQQQHHHQQQQQHSVPRYLTPQLGRAATVAAMTSSELDLRPVKSSHPALDDKEYYIAFPPSGLPVHSFRAIGAREPKTPSTPADSREFLDDRTANYANLTLAPPPGMCLPFDYVNVGATVAAKPEAHVLTVQPEIHQEPSQRSEENEAPPPPPPPPPPPTPPDSPKILNTDAKDNTDCSSVAASEEIARNFGVTLKKLPGPPAPPPRSESSPEATEEKLP